MGEILPFPSRREDNRKTADTPPSRPPETVFFDRGWRILELPSAGQFLAVSGYCRRGVEVGRFDPQADCSNYHEGSEIAILTRCGSDERLSRCAIAWLNSDGPRTAILGSFVVASGNRYRYWRDAIIEVAVIGGVRLVRLIDGGIAIARDPEPVLLLDLYSALFENRRRVAFDRLPREVQARILRWADPKRELATFWSR